MTILPQLLTIPGMAPEKQEFGAQLLKYYSALPAKKFSWPLFAFLFRHAKTIFAHKKRAFPWFSYLKHSYKSAKASTLA
jgi:hypothetical protein